MKPEMKKRDDHNKGDDVVEFVYPESVQYVECPVLRLLGKQNFPNLQSLVCQRLVTPFDLNKFPHLKVLSIYPNADELPIVEELKRQRDALGRGDSLSILVYGCEYYKSEMTFQMIRGQLPDIYMNSGDKYNTYHFDFDYQICYYRLEKKAMYEELARVYPQMIGIPMPWHFVIDYPNLVDAFDGCVPANFLDKFTAIIMVIVTRRVADERKLIDFVKRSAPGRLVLKNLRLHRNFYYELGTVQSIEWLTLGDDLKWTKSGFLSRLRNLRGVWVDISQTQITKKIPLDFVLRTFSENEHYLRFHLDKQNFGHLHIIKLPGSKPFLLTFEWSYGQKKTGNFYYPESLEELSGYPQIMEHFLES